MKNTMKIILDWYEKNSSIIRIFMTIISGVSLFASLILGWMNVNLVIDPSWIAIFLCGVPIVVGAAIGVIKDHDITADLLVSLALIGSMILREWFAAGEVAFIMQIGSILEDFTSDRAKKGIAKLIKLAPQKANLIKDGSEIVVNVDDINVDDVLIVRAGESIPVDGVIIEGTTSVDQSAMTGESLPIDKKEGDYVKSGTINQDGVFKMRATNSASDSSLQRIVRLSESADAEKAHIVRKANKWASILVVVSLLTALIAGIVIGLINSDAWLGFQRAITVLVVFCPCAFILATPTAISAGIGNASKHGILIQSGEALERISLCDTVVFDKTGTLTKGDMVVTKVQSFCDLSEKEIIRIIASGEKLSTHPLAKAVINFCEDELFDVKHHETKKGEGILFEINERKYFAGKISNEQLSKIGVENEEFSIICLMEGDSLLGLVFIEDELKPNAVGIIEELNKLGKKVVMLTGDNDMVAKKIADKVGISEYYANCTPEGKMEYIKQLEEQEAKVAMFGDGVNDSLALRRAYAGIAMGGIGSDVAIESADAVLVNDNINFVPYLFKISRKTQSRITFNLLLSLLINAVAVTLSIIGVLNTVWGALYHNVGSVLVVISAFMLLFSKDRN